MKRKEKRCRMTRRQALALLTTGAAVPLFKNPLDAILSGLVDGIIGKAQAEQSVVKPRNYVFCGLYGAPSRWYFDLPLNPYSATATNIQPMIRTRFANSPGTTAGQPEYATVPITRNGITVHMPALWGCNIPTSNGGMVPMADLAANMLIVRGINMQVDSHYGNFRRHVRPSQSAPSLNGSVADGSSTPVPAVGFGPYAPYDVYKSRKGIGQVAASGGADPLGSILGSFKRSGDGLTPAYLSRRQAMESAMNRALNSLGNFANSGAPGADALFAYRHRAEVLLKEGIGDTLGTYNLLLAKYQNLIMRCADWRTSPVIGLTDKAIPFNLMPGVDPSSVCRVEVEIAIRNPDMRTLIQPNSDIGGLAASFAVAEYLLLNGFSSTVAMGPSGYFGLSFENRVNFVTSPAVALASLANQSIPFDEHTSGLLTNMMTSTLHYRSLAACLYEFITKLRGAGIFDETVIQIGSEFSRNPHDGMDGADHGWIANTTSFFSGAITSPIVVGNVYNNQSFSSTASNTSWGHSAPVKVDGGSRQLLMGHSSSTCAELLRVSHAMPNDSTLVRETSQGVEATVELARNVEKA